MRRGGTRRRLCPWIEQHSCQPPARDDPRKSRQIRGVYTLCDLNSGRFHVSRVSARDSFLRSADSGKRRGSGGARASPPGHRQPPIFLPCRPRVPKTKIKLILNDKFEIGLANPLPRSRVAPFE